MEQNRDTRQVMFDGTDESIERIIELLRKKANVYCNYYMVGLNGEVIIGINNDGINEIVLRRGDIVQVKQGVPGVIFARDN